MKKLTVREAALLLSASEKDVYHWIAEGVLPAHRIHDQYRINRAELLEWATERRLRVSPDIFAAPEGETALPSLSEALRAGGIHYRVGGDDKASALRAVVDRLALPDDVDREFLYQVLLAREALGSTALGDGIAIPHVRNPIVLQHAQPSVSLCFLEHPVDFGSIDGLPVTTLFTLISPTVRGHLHWLSRLAFVLRNPRFKAAIRTQASAEEIQDALRVAELAVAASAKQPGAAAR